jgi:ABC-type Fe3+-citrate transport system substrate-binding protein
MNDTIQQIINNLIAEQKEDESKIEKHKALMIELKKTVDERHKVIEVLQERFTQQ